MSEYDPKRKWRLNLFDDLVGVGEDRRRDGEAKSPRPRCRNTPFVFACCEKAHFLRSQ